MAAVPEPVRIRKTGLIIEESELILGNPLQIYCFFLFLGQIRSVKKSGKSQVKVSFLNELEPVYTLKMYELLG